MTHDKADDGMTDPNSPAGIGERLIYLKQRARHCRRVARSSGDQTVAAALEAMAAQFEAEAAQVIAQAGKP